MKWNVSGLCGFFVGFTRICTVVVFPSGDQRGQGGHGLVVVLSGHGFGVDRHHPPPSLSMLPCGRSVGFSRFAWEGKHGGFVAVGWLVVADVVVRCGHSFSLRPCAAGRAMVELLITSGS